MITLHKISIFSRNNFEWQKHLIQHLNMGNNQTTIYNFKHQTTKTLPDCRISVLRSHYQQDRQFPASIREGWLNAKHWLVPFNHSHPTKIARLQGCYLQSQRCLRYISWYHYFPLPSRSWRKNQLLKGKQAGSQ